MTTTVTAMIDIVFTESGPTVDDVVRELHKCIASKREHQAAIDGGGALSGIIPAFGRKLRSEAAGALLRERITRGLRELDEVDE